MMTQLAQRVRDLMAHEAFDATLVAAILGIDVAVVESLLSAPDEVVVASPASLKHIVFPFAFDTPGLLEGVSCYAAQKGERLFAEWLEVDTAWDGITPRADFGIFDGSVAGILSVFTAVYRLDDGVWPDGSALGVGPGIRFPALATGDFSYFVSGAVFTDDRTLRVVVSQDGTAGGADPGATQGAAELHLLVVGAA